ncbi:MAG: hypothetical protein HYY06_02080 [Deltaproteobacteria bacterium]|nr:hypothetical protein [Deltaproteobacteria bacterium]
MDDDRRPKPHWEDRDEPAWAEFRFQQPYAKGLERLRRDVLSRPDFDPAVLWQWGTMQAMAVVEILRSVEERWGAEGQRVVGEALRRIGRDVGRQILEGAALPESASEAEVASFYATVINRIPYASIEEPRIEDDSKVSFDIVWCPHQDHYGAFDCRVQRYLVQGMIDAAGERPGGSSLKGWEVRFDSTIPSGAPTCHFTLWRATSEEREAWARVTELIEAKALARARK